MPPLPGFVGGSYQSESRLADQERTENWYVEKLQSAGASSETALYPTPGVKELSRAGLGPGRAHFFMDEREFAVIGSSLIEIDYNGTQTVHGSVAIDMNPATISTNGDGGGQLFITSGGNGYVFDLDTDTLSQVAALNGKATMGGQVDGYFLALDANTSTFYISALYDGTSWSTGVDFAQRSRAPDPWKAMRIVEPNVWLLGEQSSEVWYNSGAASFPFEPRAESGVIKFGIAAPFSTGVIGRDLIWLSQIPTGDVRIMRASGSVPEVVSDYPTQAIITGYARTSKISDARADTRSDRGHNFYTINFPSANASWEWDAETREWYGRGTWDIALNQQETLRTRWHVYAFGEHRILDSVTGAVYRLSSEYGTDVDGKPIRRLRRAPALVTDNERVFYASFEVDLENGLGLESGQGEDPQVMMRMSNDGGRTWGPERWRSAGKQGDYLHRARWLRCGQARRRVFEISVTDPVPWRVTNAYVNFAQPPSAAPNRGRQQEVQTTVG